jgi:hypothetical protein
VTLFGALRSHKHCEPAMRLSTASSYRLPLHSRTHTPQQPPNRARHYCFPIPNRHHALYSQQSRDLSECQENLDI